MASPKRTKTPSHAVNIKAESKKLAASRKTAALAKTHPNVSTKTISKMLSDGSKETYSMISEPETKHQVVVRRIEAADSINALEETSRVAYFTTFTCFQKLPVELRLRIWHIALQEEAKYSPRLALVHSYSAPHISKPTLLQVNVESYHQARKMWKAFKVMETTLAARHNPPPRFVYVHRKMDVLCLFGVLPPEKDQVVNRLLMQMTVEKIENLAVSHSWFREVFLDRETSSFLAKHLDVLMTEGKLKVIYIVDSQSIEDAGQRDIKLVRDRKQMQWLRYYRYDFEEQNRNRGWGWKGILKIRGVREDED